MPSSSCCSNGRKSVRYPLDTLDLPVGSGKLAFPRQLVDHQMAAYGKIDQGRGDVDRIDPLVGHRADMARPDIVDHPEFRLPGTGRHEFAHLADLAVGLHVDPSPPMNGRNSAIPPRTSRPKARASGSGLAEKARPSGPLVVDHLVRRDATRGKPDVDRHYLALATRSVAKGRNLRTLGAGSSKVAGDSGVWTAGGALDVAELGWYLHHCAELRDRNAEALQHAPTATPYRRQW